jgi:hypothetical protein
MAGAELHEVLFKTADGSRPKAAEFGLSIQRDSNNLKPAW